MKLDRKQVQNFLTIRYNPLDTPIIPPASWQDFRVTESDQNGKRTELLLQKSILKSMPEKEKTITRANDQIIKTVFICSNFV